MSEEPYTREDFVEALSLALDEIYALRCVLASEARTLEATLEYKTFPKTRRRFAEESVRRMRAAAAGEVVRIDYYDRVELRNLEGTPIVSSTYLRPGGAA